jgi:hypothetical protein
VDLAGPLLPRAATGRARETPRLRASSPEAPAVPSLLAPLKDARAAEFDTLAGAIVRGTGDSFSQIEASGRKPAAPAAAAAAAPAALTLTAARAPASAAAPPPPPASAPPPGERPNFGPTVRDVGRGAFDGASMALPEDVSLPVAPTRPTARRCTIANPCKTVD